MAFDRGLVDWVVEACEPMGSVSMRHMMGCAMLYLDGTVFGLVDESDIWFKADAISNAVWDEAGCERFTFTGSDGKTESLNYRRGPADVYDDADAMREWAGVAVAAGLRAPKKKPKAKKL
ncbi:MAG: TfoX family protein [Sphingomonadales bacterium]|nr:MAG: TfoX family protein [Sphingomonadales bacterium]